MTTFDDRDGRTWTARVHESAELQADLLARVGWDLILFTSAGSFDQRFVYRPHGWLATAAPHALRAALAEGEAIRAYWGVPPDSAA
jgi:hypothetical protein